MRQAVLDTDILSYILDQRYPEVLSSAKQYVRVFRYFSLSTLTVLEILKGLRLVRDIDGEKNFLVFLDGCELLPLDVEEADLSASILAELTRTGRQIGSLDPLIAATAIVQGRPLITNNTKHYQRVVDLGFPLELENWRSS